MNSIEYIEGLIEDPKVGLPDEVFYLVGRLTPFINVDLLIRDYENRILLTWRDDQFCGSGWHFPGGIIRFQEKMTTRVHKVARLELKAEVDIINGPIKINEIIAQEQKERSHFISLLYECKINEELTLDLFGELPEKSKYIKYFSKIPNNLLQAHTIYKEYFLNE